MNKRAQHITEYALIIAVVAAALLGMGLYLKRGMQGRLRTQADKVSGAAFYAPGATKSTSVVTKETEASSYVEDFSGKMKKHVKSALSKERSEDVFSSEEEATAARDTGEGGVSVR